MFGRYSLSRTGRLQAGGVHYKCSLEARRLSEGDAYQRAALIRGNAVICAITGTDPFGFVLV